MVSNRNLVAASEDGNRATTSKDKSDGHVACAVVICEVRALVILL
jgi:hypothetical protein